MQDSASTMFGMFCTPLVTSCSLFSSVTVPATGFSFGVPLVLSIAPGVLPVGLTQPVTPTAIKTNISNRIIFFSMSLLTAVFTTDRCMYLECVYDDVFWKPSAILPALTPDLITYFCVPLAPALTSLRRSLNINFCLASRIIFWAYAVIVFVSLITLLYRLFMRCQQGRYAY